MKVVRGFGVPVKSVYYFLKEHNIFIEKVLKVFDERFHLLNNNQ